MSRQDFEMQTYERCSPEDVRRLAYEYASHLGIKVPAAWERDKMAGKTWFTNFLKRSSERSIRNPEATGLGRAMLVNLKNATTEGRRKRKAAILTNIPGKSTLAIEQVKSVRCQPQTKAKTDTNRKRNKVCLMCNEAFRQGQPMKKRIQCNTCEQWAHQKCIPPDNAIFICTRCTSIG
ncbi:uncharacterized protein LOC129718136 [Wyeomyia smithii]|uniref:uncharacterized protein LOC129718136 n=1 Tax=Wyeomyia smithii TaxID=174621 RepID=UPI002467C6CF|nr:uncharacterized protein LOC129718136 [Wyeomyia smithii]